MADLSVTHSIIKTNASYSCFDIEPIGIGYLANWGDYLVVNNISHNTEISRLEKSCLAPIAIYNETAYSNDLHKAAFDLDMHAVLRREDKKSWLMINHFGRLKFFDADINIGKKKPAYLNPKSESLWLADVEQTLLLSDCLISTSPGGYYVDEPARPGFYVSAPLSTLKEVKKVAHRDIERLESVTYMANLGMSTAIAVNSTADNLAVAFGKDVFVYRIDLDKNGFLSFDEIISHMRVDYYVRYLVFWREDYLLSAGHEVPGEENTDEASNLKGGGYTVVDFKKNRISLAIDFNCDLAWGNGGQCLAIHESNFSNRGRQSIKELLVLGIDKQANLMAWNSQIETAKALFSNENESTNLGIAHLVLTREKIICGFNRGGARLHIYPFSVL